MTEYSSRHSLLRDDDVIITKKQLLAMIPYSGMHIGRLEKAGRFPKRIRVGENRVGWILREIREWIAARRAATPLTENRPSP